jgi:hypothetical protein
MAPHRHFVVDVTVTSVRTNTNVPRIGARLPLFGSLALGAQHGKLDADFCFARHAFSSVDPWLPSPWRMGPVVADGG